MPAPDGLSPAQRRTAVSLMLDAAAAEVVAALAHAGVRSILLRGPSLLGWLYDEGEARTYEDVDLLVARNDFGTAEPVLLGLAFRHVPVDAFGDARHARIWRRAGDGAEVDLHRSLVGIGAPPDRVWSALSRRTAELAVGGARLETLDEPARLLCVVLHAAQHSGWFRKALDDLERAVDRLPHETWRQAASLAGDLQALAAFRAGLQLAPDGDRLLTSLALPEERTVESALRAGAAPHTALGFMRLSGTAGLRPKLSYAARKVVPPVGYMKSTSRLAGRGTLGLALAYAWRPAWLAWHALPGFRAWNRARREAGS